MVVQALDVVDRSNVGVALDVGQQRQSKEIHGSAVVVDLNTVELLVVGPADLQIRGLRLDAPGVGLVLEDALGGAVLNVGGFELVTMLVDEAFACKSGSRD